MRPLHCLLTLQLLSFAKVHYAVKLTEEAVFANIKFSKTAFFDNTTLADDVALLDKEFKEASSRIAALEVSSHLDIPTPTKLELHVLVVTDYSMFEAFRDLYGDDFYTLYHALYQYSTSVFHQLSTIFDRLTFFNDTQIALKLSGVLPVIRVEDCPLHANKPSLANDTGFDPDEMNITMSDTTSKVMDGRTVDALEAVHLLQDWISANQEVLPSHDHAVLLTKFDLLSMRNESSTQGMAYVRSMCRGAESVSVIEDVGGFTSSAIAAHEIAHTLGALHDGTGPSKSCHPRDNFMMSPSVSSFRSGKFENTVLLSRCSVQQIENFLRSPDSSCLWKKVDKQRGPRKLKSDKRMPGEAFDKNQQCKFAFGTSYGYCAKYDIRKGEDPCRRLWCNDRRKIRRAACETKGYLPQMDGSECGPSMWCMSGQCVPNGKEPLDEDCRDVNANFCRNMCPVKMTAFCRSKSFAQVCCRSCRERLAVSDQHQKARRKTHVPHKISLEEL